MRRFEYDPIAYLKAIGQMAQRTDRALVGWTLDDLEWCERAWEQVAIVGMGDDAFVHERDRYRHLVKQLKAGMVERQDDGVMMMEPQDWPHPMTIKRAIAALEYAQVNKIK